MWGLDKIGIGKWLEDNNFSITGYGELGYFYDMTVPKNVAPPRSAPPTFIQFPGDYKNQFLINQLDLAIQRTVRSDKFDVGFMIEAFYGRFGDMCAVAYPEMAALIERLHGAGTKLYVLSNAPNLLDPWLRGAGREQHPSLGLFSDYVVSGLVGHSKPDAGIYELACRTGGFEPGSAVFIDDVLANVEGARAIGMHAVHHQSPAETIRALQALGLPA